MIWILFIPHFRGSCRLSCFSRFCPDFNYFLNHRSCYFTGLLIFYCLTTFDFISSRNGFSSCLTWTSWIIFLFPFNKSWIRFILCFNWDYFCFNAILSWNFNNNISYFINISLRFLSFTAGIVFNKCHSCSISMNKTCIQDSS